MRIYSRCSYVSIPLRLYLRIYLAFPPFFLRGRARGENSAVSSKNTVKSLVPRVPITKQLLVQMLASKRTKIDSGVSLPPTRMTIRRPVYPTPEPQTPTRPAKAPTVSAPTRPSAPTRRSAPTRPSAPTQPSQAPIFSRPRKPPTKNEGPVRRTLFSNQIKPPRKPLRKPER